MPNIKKSIIDDTQNEFIYNFNLHAWKNMFLLVVFGVHPFFFIKFCDRTCRLMFCQNRIYITAKEFLIVEIF